MKKLLLLGTLALAAAGGNAAQADTVRAAVGKPLQQAEALIARRDYAAALTQVSKARAVGHLTPYESLAVAQIDGIAASGAGAYTRAAGDYETVLDSGSVSPAARVQYSQAIAGFYDQAQDYPHTVLWVNKYIAAGGADPRTRILLAQAYYSEGDFAHAQQAVQRDEKTASAAGQIVPESELQLLASSANKSGDQQGYQAALEDLLKSYPNPQTWSASIASVTAAAGFPDRLTLDVDRLRLATGTLTDPGDYEDYAERAILAGDPVEAHQVIEKGFATGVLTAQTDAGHAARLRVLAAKQAAGAPASPNVSIAGDPDGLLDQGIAYENAGNRDQAESSFKTVADAGPAANPDAALARLWLIYVDRPTATQMSRNGA